MRYWRWTLLEAIC